MTDTWQVRGFDGSRRVIRTGHEVRFPLDLMGYDSWGLLSDYPARYWPGNAHPVRRIGIAVQGIPSVAVFQAVTDPATLRRIRSVIAMPMDSAARAAAGPAGPRARAAISARGIRLERGVRLIFVSAHRPLPGNAECPDLVTFEGWLALGERVQILRRDVQVADCERKGVLSFFPYGIIRHAGRQFIVGAERGWEHDEARVFDLAGLRNHP